MSASCLDVLRADDLAPTTTAGPRPKAGWSFAKSLEDLRQRVTGSLGVRDDPDRALEVRRRASRRAVPYAPRIARRFFTTRHEPLAALIRRRRSVTWGTVSPAQVDEVDRLGALGERLARHRRSADLSRRGSIGSASLRLRISTDGAVDRERRAHGARTDGSTRTYFPLAAGGLARRTAMMKARAFSDEALLVERRLRDRRMDDRGLVDLELHLAGLDLLHGLGDVEASPSRSSGSASGPAGRAPCRACRRPSWCRAWR